MNKTSVRENEIKEALKLRQKRAQRQQQYRQKKSQQDRFRPLGNGQFSPEVENAVKVKTVAYKSNRVHLPAVKIVGPPPSKNKLSETKRFHAGDLCSPAQRRLADIGSFTGTYKTRFEGNHVKYAEYAGDYAKNPREAAKLLLNRTNAELTVPGRAADFRNEVTWRMQLRGDH